ncbi:MAG: 30S ribosomal protein S6 [Candidatus Omnitrophota bacterium]
MERDYEGFMILDPTLSEETVEKEAARIAASFPEGKATCQNLGRKKFAYPIKKQTQGYYLLCNFNADAQKRTELEQTLRGNPALLRYLIIRALRPKKKDLKAQG